VENGHHKNFAFGAFRLETELQTLLRDSVEIHLAKRPFEVLVFLIENRGRVVTRDELLAKFWEGHSVYDDALRKCVGVIRKALDDTERSPRFIETRRGSGYHFVGTVFESNGKAEEVGSRQLAAGANGTEPIDRIKRTSKIVIKNRPVLFAVFASLSILIAGFAFVAYRSQQTNSEVKNLTETVAVRRSIAVLPLKNLTGDAANDFVVDGITESIINELSRIPNLKVISRSSVFQFQNKAALPQEIGEKLGVEIFLEGGVRVSGDKIRVETRLVDTKDGSVLWANDSNPKSFGDILAIQDGIVCQLVAELKVKLCDEVQDERYRSNPAAYQMYLKGLFYRNQLELEKAVEFFNEALRIEPDYALAHEGLAGVYVVMESNSQIPPGTAAPLAEFHANRALELDENLVGGYIALGAAKTMLKYDLAESERYYRQALLKNPNHRTARLWLAYNFTAQGKFADAEREILLVRELDPLSFGVRLNLAELYYYWRKPDKSIEQAELMLLASPGDETAYSLLARNFVQKGEIDEAFAVLKRASPENTARALVLAASGQTDEARKIAEAAATSNAASKSLSRGLLVCR